MIKGKNILLGVSGGIAAYKVLELCSRLKKEGANLKIIMTKAEVITKVAETTGITKKDTGAMVDAFLQVITNELASGGKVAFTGFGSFSVVERAARECRNPQTGETMMTEARLAPKFKAGKALKDAVK